MEELESKINEISKEVTKVQKQAKAISIVSQEDVVHATELLGAVKARITRIEDLRTFFVKPLNEQVKKINAMFKAQSEPLEVITASVKRAIGDYVLAEQKRARAEEDRIAKLREKQNERREEKGLEPITKPLPTVEQPKPTAVSESAKTTAMKVWKYRVMDVNQVPREYLRCEVKHADVQRIINCGTREIPGLEIYEDVEVRVTSY